MFNKSSFIYDAFFLVPYRVDELELLQDCEDESLPEGEEDDGLDRKELDDWVEGAEQVVGREVEQEQGVQGQGDAHVVDEGGVQVALAGGPVALVVQVQGLNRGANI